MSSLLHGMNNRRSQHGMMRMECSWIQTSSSHEKPFETKIHWVVSCLGWLRAPGIRVKTLFLLLVYPVLVLYLYCTVHVYLYKYKQNFLVLYSIPVMYSPMKSWSQRVSSSEYSTCTTQVLAQYSTCTPSTPLKKGLINVVY